MQDQFAGLPGPDFLDKVADAELAHGHDVNADIFRQRAHEWRQLAADYEQLQQRNAVLQQSLDKARKALTPAAA